MFEDVRKKCGEHKAMMPNIVAKSYPKTFTDHLESQIESLKSSADTTASWHSLVTPPGKSTTGEIKLSLLGGSRPPDPR